MILGVALGTGNNNLKGGGRHLRLGGGGGGRSVVCVRKHAHARGVWGYAPPGKFCKLDALRVLLRPLLAQRGTTVIVVICTSSYVVQRVQTSEFPVLSTV